MKKLFPLNKVRLLDGIFLDSQIAGANYLKQLDPDRLIAPCYIAANKTPKKERYGGWESRDIAGHSLGHWLSAASLMYAAAGDEKLYEKLCYAVSELESLQDSDGYVGGVEKSALLRVFSGDFEAEPFSLAGVWVPWYSLHKIFAGLLDAHIHAGIPRALETVCGMLDFAAAGILGMSDDDVRRMLICEHGGMNEVFAIGYELTKKREYLDAALKFSDMRILEPLCKSQDKLAGLHANTQIPKILGAERIACADSKHNRFLQAADFFLETVLKHRSYCLGGHGDHEHFTAADTEPLGTETCETCNSYNMLKLISRKFLRTGNAAEFDDYERILYNHILAAQEPETGMKCYFMSTKPGHFKVYSTPYDSFWCCVGTGMENPALYNRDIYAYENDTLYINLFIPSAVEFDGSILELTGAFPYSGHMKITLKSGSKKRIAVRLPAWCQDIVCSQEYTVCNGYMVFDKAIECGESIEWYLPREAGIYHAKSSTEKISFFYGPILLAGAMGRENFPETDFLPVHFSLNHHPTPEAAKLLRGVPIELTPLDLEAMIFEIPSKLMSTGNAMQLVPYFSLHHERYALYFEFTSPDEVAAAKSNENDFLIADEIICAQQQPEIEHAYHITGKTITGYLEDIGANYREVYGGEFGYTLSKQPGVQHILAIDYYGEDDDFWSEGRMMRREFDIIADGIVIASEHLHYTGKKIKTCLYPITASDKDTLEISFKARNQDSVAGKILAIRLLAKKV